MKKRIVISSLVGRGGTFQYICLLASNLTKYADISMLIPKYSDASLVNKKINLLRTKAPPSAIRTIFLSLNIVQHARNIKKLNAQNPDVLIFADIHPWHVLYWPFLKAKKKISVIHDAEIHSGEANAWMLRKITAFFLRKSDKIIVLSKSQKKIIQEKGFGAKVILSIHGHFDFFSKYAKSVKEEPGTILFFGRIKEYKGLKYLLEASSLIKIKHKIMIVGEGDLSKYDLTGIEVHNKFIPDPKVANYFRRASIVVLPYIGATQTGIIPIAYSFKKPVVVTNVGSLPDVVINGKTGFIVCSKDPQKLAEKILKILSDDSLRKKMGNSAYRFMKENLNWKKISEDLNFRLFP